MRRYRRRRRDAQGLWVPVTRHNLTLPYLSLLNRFDPFIAHRLHDCTHYYTLICRPPPPPSFSSPDRTNTRAPTQPYALARAHPHDRGSCSSSVVAVVAAASPLFSSLGRHGKNMFHGRTYDSNNSSNHFPLFRQPQQILNFIPPPPPTRHP